VRSKTSTETFATSLKRLQVIHDTDEMTKFPTRRALLQEQF